MSNGKIKLNFVIVCDNAFIAQGTNSLNIIGIFDRINTQKFPAVHPRLVIVTNISGEPGEYIQLIVIKNKITGNKIAELSGKLIINKEGQKAQFLGNFFNLVFPLSGEYIVEAYINDILQDLTANIYVG
jgi:hypothetical protein